MKLFIFLLIHIILGVMQCQSNNNGYHGNDISQIGKLAVWKREDVDRHIPTKFDFL